MVVVVLLVALAATMAGAFPFRQIVAQNRQVENTAARLEVLQVENARLEAKIDALHTPIEMERLAREHLGMVQPGEEGYAVEGQPELSTFRPDPPEPFFEDRTPVERLWDFLTGRDLEPDE